MTTSKTSTALSGVCLASILTNSTAMMSWMAKDKNKEKSSCSRSPVETMPTIWTIYAPRSTIAMTVPAIIKAETAISTNEDVTASLAR